MELGAFTRALRELGLEDLRLLAKDLENSAATAEHEIAAMRAVLAVDDVLRAVRQRQIAALAAHAASEAVQTAARRAGVDLPDVGVTRVARSAAEIARAIVAGPRALASLRVLAGDWHRLAVHDDLLAA
jgi:hypothetical protein